MRQYDDKHPFAVHTPKGVRWLGDPARGEFKPADRKRSKIYRKRGVSQ